MVDVLDEYLSKLPGSPVKRVEELVVWNKDHAEEALPAGIFSNTKVYKEHFSNITAEYASQDVLIQALNTKLTTDQIEKLRKHYLAVGSYLDTTFQYYEINIIVAPGDCFLTQYASAKGTISIFCSQTLLAKSQITHYRLPHCYDSDVIS